MRNKLIEIHYHGGTMICSFVSYKVKDHIFDIQREKCTHGVFMSLFSWNCHLKCHLDGDGPLQRDSVMLGKTLVTGLMQASPKGYTQQVALHLLTYSACCHGKQEPGKAGRRSSATPNHGASHLFHPPFGFHRDSVPWQQTKYILWWRYLCAVKIYISQTQQEALYISPAVPRERQGG